MKDFIRISKYAGMREDLVQAGGGNSSFKLDEEKMYIKASGYRLDDVSEYTGYCAVKYKMIQDFFKNSVDVDSVSSVDCDKLLKDALIEGGRPSIETFMHSFMGKYTLHTHPVSVNAIACRKHGMNDLASLFPHALIVPYATPGADLAKAFFRAYSSLDAMKSEHVGCKIAFLQNHGLIVSGSSADEVIAETERTLDTLDVFIGRDNSLYQHTTQIWDFFKDKIVWAVTDTHVIEYYRKQDRLWNHTFCPDCVVFLGKSFLDARFELNDEVVSEYVKKNGQLPVVVAHKGNLYIIADRVEKAMQIQSVLSFSAQVMEINEGKECELLPEWEQDKLLNWDAEKYRRTLRHL